ncbi:MAG: ABC transporter ATP-binding protein [Methylobacter tundripaludum]|uniref:ABC-2 type transport system ATP-binding protein n=1 Tax=Methylobacter tundripaludum TaxID=173365 RepID=A0A2S6GVZ2_9GAMM|nr:ABC transporter ATP-binding protein [Methylobacter tundripaludum]MCK9637851.1 ABC transporter ATP-binding protein [Methylobacter tundripaludum]PPK69379.1 ABC-2 type transport system ATP-binding protein [Methylobacter tundripaludum]
MTALIEAEHLTRYYGKHCAVNDVSFALAKGEVLGFLGANGAGKTTTMQMLCGNLAPSAGQIKINGFDLLDQPKAAKLSLGYLPDTPPLYKELTVQEFLLYCARLHGIAKNSIPDSIKRAQERCGLTEVADRLIANLSKGFQQRIGIAQAILHNPEVIVLDEPTVGLDPIQIREIRALIRELGQDHGVILSTHRLTEVQESCSHVQIIDQGQLILNETVAGLNRQMDTGTLQVLTRLPSDINKLSAIPGVNSIESISANRIRIHHSVTANPAEHIAEQIIAAGWGLQELTPVKRSMEDIFISLTKEHREL